MIPRRPLPALAEGISTLAEVNGSTEFSFSQADFERVRSLLRQHTGISLSEAKRSMVYSRLARRLRATGVNSFQAYLERLRTGAGEWEHFVNALTTNLTYFYRESHHFQILAAHLKQAARPGKTVQIWCAAASTGEECWTLAMTAAEALGSLSPPVQIIGTDLDTNVLDQARKGVYSEEQIAKVPQAQVRRYFVQTSPGVYSVRPELRALVSFRPLNLLDPTWGVRGPFDAVFCRNVLIYFERETQLQVVSRMAPLMQPDGLLFVGHSENFSHGQNAFMLQGKTVYARVS